MEKGEDPDCCIENRLQNQGRIRQGRKESIAIIQGRDDGNFYQRGNERIGKK